MKIIKLTGTIELLSGLHIGGGDDTMKIGGIDNGVVKDVNTDKPYIPGSSLKGKMRSLLEWDIGVVNLKRSEKEQGLPLSSKHIWKWDSDNKKFLKDQFVDVAFEDKKLFNKAQTLLKLFGDKEGEFGITRISIGDCYITKKQLELSDFKVTESKWENTIDRQTGTARHGVGARQTERVPAGVMFNYDIRIKVLEGDNEEDLIEMVKRGFELIESDYLGGNGSRGYGRVRFISD